MNPLLTNIVEAALKLVPLERLVAAGLNLLIQRIGSEPAAKTAKTFSHIREACDLAEHILADGAVSPEEVAAAKARVQDLRVQLLDIWARGEPSKPAEAALARAETTEGNAQ
jgi:hypothetical protein